MYDNTFIVKVSLKSFINVGNQQVISNLKIVLVIKYENYVVATSYMTLKTNEYLTLFKGTGEDS